MCHSQARQSVPRATSSTRLCTSVNMRISQSVELAPTTRNMIIIHKKLLRCPTYHSGIQAEGNDYLFGTCFGLFSFVFEGWLKYHLYSDYLAYVGTVHSLSKLLPAGAPPLLLLIRWCVPLPLFRLDPRYQHITGRSTLILITNK